MDVDEGEPMDTRIRDTGGEPRRKDSNIIWFAEECLNNGIRLDGFVYAAESRGDSQLADFFRRALDEAGKIQGGDPRLGRLRHVARLSEYRAA
jgi:hypothetical protein